MSNVKTRPRETSAHERVWAEVKWGQVKEEVIVDKKKF